MGFSRQPWPPAQMPCMVSQPRDALSHSPGVPLLMAIRKDARGFVLSCGERTQKSRSRGHHERHVHRGGIRVNPRRLRFHAPLLASLPRSVGTCRRLWTCKRGQMCPPWILPTPRRLIWLFLSIVVPFGSVLIARALVHKVYVRAPGFWKLPSLYLCF